jgi:hypothetical protein
MTIRRVHAEARKSPEPPTIKPCPTCGRDVKVYVCTPNKRFCSIACRTSSYRGAGNPKWRGGRIVDPNGRVLIYAPDHPNPTTNGTHVYEYRLIAELQLGRFLRSDEIVHHKNGDPTDNRPENLEVMTQAQHLLAHGLPRLGGIANANRYKAVANGR